MSDSRSQHADIERLFGEQGPLAAAIEAFHARPSQMEMARAIGQAIHEKTTLMAEAGTGTGKTFAYLVPALLWGGKVILSTGTKNLQDQLFLRDIPTVRKALKVPISVALLKGRANYVCHLHLERTQEQGRLTSRQDIVHLRELRRFMKTTSTGDKAELSTIPENAPIWDAVTSTRESCHGMECAHYTDCFVMKARKEAQKADMVVVNHHLFFADVALKDSGLSDLLPEANTIIFDEAHQLPEVATLFFGENLSTSHVSVLCRDVLAEGLTHARDGADWTTLVAQLEKATQDLRLALVPPQTSQTQTVQTSQTIRISANALVSTSEFFPALQTFNARLAAMVEVLEKQAERAETLEQARVRAIELQQRLVPWQAMLSANTEGGSPSLEPKAATMQENVLWLEVFSNTLQLHCTPLSIAPIFTKQREGAPRAWIFTSATLAVKQNFDHYATQMGLQGEPAKTWPSPFDYGTQGLLYVPHHLPLPHMAHYTDSVMDVALPMIIAARGRTFLLCTTLRAVKHAAERCRAAFDDAGLDFPLIVQGEAGRTELLDRFRRAGNAVLIGSQSFWEGVDVRGEVLSLVIIDKLPFAPPDDPVLAARLAALEKQGKNGFMDHQLPAAIIALKQGAGRLIRNETDRGVLMICDPRLISKPYGRRIWQSLPPFKRTRELAVAQGFLSGSES